MSGKFSPLDPKALRQVGLHQRRSLVSREDFGRAWTPGGSLTDFLGSLPKILAGRDLRDAALALANARRAGKTVTWATGAHLVKTGLAPVLASLMEAGVISLLAVNGAVLIHDVEIALCGRTSEDVAAGLADGSYGVTRETAEFLSGAARRAARGNLGLGEAVGREIQAAAPPFAGESLLAAAFRLGVPVTVHVALGTDVWHIAPGFDAAAAAGASHRDFLLFAGAVATLSGGVHVNSGSAVILPEVFLKALTLARNLGRAVAGFTAVNLDFSHQYRPAQNVTGRPVSEGGRGISLVGSHEILIPLLAAAVLEELRANP